MKITAFDPVIFTPEFGDTVALFEELGFKITHRPKAKPKGVSVNAFRMKHEDGYHLDILESKGDEQGRTNIRINVDDFDEARGILIAHGLVDLDPNDPHDSPSHKGMEMISPTGTIITLMQHIRKE